MSRLPFTKMTGTGNDFIVVDARRPAVNGLKGRWPSASRALCDRHTGIGADGLLVLERSPRADVRMRVFNPDGSEAAMCGNGARCIARYLGTAVTIDTRAGVLSARVRGDRVAMRMTDPRGLRLGQSLRVGGRRIAFGFVDTGGPHVVVPLPSADRLDVRHLGQALRRHRAFAPRGANIDFIQRVTGRPNRLRIRTYERGVEDETLACGTGIAAAAVVHGAARRIAGGRASANGRGRPCCVEVQARSGDVLTVSFLILPGPRITELVLEGGARRVFDGVLELSKGRG